MRANKLRSRVRRLHALVLENGDFFPLGKSSPESSQAKPEDNVFHHLVHTWTVRKSVADIMRRHNQIARSGRSTNAFPKVGPYGWGHPATNPVPFTGREKLLGQSAAVTHDVDYRYQPFRHNEKATVSVITPVLARLGFNGTEIGEISRAILSTFPQFDQRRAGALSTRPGDHPLSKVLCDADMSHVGTANFWRMLPLLRRELMHAVQSGVWSKENVMRFANEKGLMGQPGFEVEKHVVLAPGSEASANPHDFRHAVFYDKLLKQLEVSFVENTSWHTHAASDLYRAGQLVNLVLVRHVGVLLPERGDGEMNALHRMLSGNARMRRRIRSEADAVEFIRHNSKVLAARMPHSS